MLWFLICGLQSAAKYSSHCSEVHCIPTQLAQYLSQAGRLNHTRVALFVWNMSGLHGRWRIPCLCGAWEIPSTSFFLRLSHGQVRPKTATVWLALGNWEIHSSGNQKNERTSLTSGGLSCGASTGHLDLVFQCWLVSWSKFVLQNTLEVNQRKGTESLASHKKNLVVVITDHRHSVDVLGHIAYHPVRVDDMDDTQGLALLLSNWWLLGRPGHVGIQTCLDGALALDVPASFDSFWPTVGLVFVHLREKNVEIVWINFVTWTACTYIAIW